MIEFTPDGPFAGRPDPLFPDRVRIIGLGQTGAAVCDQLVLHGRGGQDLWVFDSDQQTIDSSIVPNRHLLGRTLVHGLGSSGDLELAREIVALEESRLVPMTRGCDFLILILGLAGCTGLALSEYLIEESRKAGARVIVVGVMPFAFEGWARRQKAVRAIAQLRREADSVLVLAQDRLAEDPAMGRNVRHGFHVMHQIVAASAQALVQIVCKRGLVQLSFADVRSLYGRYTGAEALENCWVAHIEGEIHERPEELIDRLLKTPLVNDESIWKQVDHAILAISGTRELGLSDVQELVGLLKDRMPAHLPLVASASLDEEGHDKVRLTVLLAMTAPVTAPATRVEPAPARRKTTQLAASEPAALEPPAPEPIAPEPDKPKPAPVVAKVAAKKTARPAAAPKAAPLQPPSSAPALPAAGAAAEPFSLPVPEDLYEPEPAPSDSDLLTDPVKQTTVRFVAKQEEMHFEAPPRGRFERTVETIYNGENLDQPTFRRRNLVIRL